ncbi:MAG: hypothetical protein IPP05_22185 [Cytophagaceae bacterium]|nr:hypothetical protein [Cytophagaceae bacterium]
MSSVSIFPKGKLNRDSDLNTLPSGDYSDARNIVISAGKGGGADTIKILESIKNIGIVAKTGTLKAWHKAPDGKIYLLYRTDSTNASIYVVPITRDAITTVITYAHTVSTDFTPDLKVIGDNIVWNYYGSGKLLYWSTTRTNGLTPTAQDLLFAKSPPVGAYTVSKTITANLGIDFLELNDIQFASRYKYDNGEYSVLSAYSEMFKGVKDTADYTFVFNNTNRPLYATGIDLYCRIGDYGTWRRIMTAPVTSVPSNFVWKGQFFETLSTDESSQLFSAVPDVVGNIEVAIDRLFVADYVDDYTNDSVGQLVIGSGTGYVIPTGGTIKNYFGADTTDAGTNSNETGTYYKPFANNSQYAMGVVIYDAALKTRGVEFITYINTGQFTTPYLPTITINSSGYTKPSYAKWMQLCCTRNLTKSNTFEGFANSIYFEVEYEETSGDNSSTVTKSIKNKLSVAGTETSKVKSLVVDISGLYKAGIIYNFNQGDRIQINVPDSNPATTDGDGAQTGTFRVLDLEVSYGDSQKIYCVWTGGDCLNDGLPNMSKFYFEIYSIKSQSEETNTLFYAVGDMIDISSTIPSTITNYHIGDTVFKKIEIAAYTAQYLQKGYIKSSPAIVTTSATTLVKSTKVVSDVSTLVTYDLFNAQGSDISYEYIVPFDAFGALNDDGGVITNGGFIAKGYYDSISTITIQNLLEFTNTMNVNDGEGVQIVVTAQVVKRTFDQQKQSFSSYTNFTDTITVYNMNLGGYGMDIDSEFIFIDSANVNILQNQTIGSGDELKIKYSTSVYLTSPSALASGNFSIKNRNGYTSGTTLTLTGDRIAPAFAYFQKDSVPVSGSKTTFLIRSISNTQQVTGWNTSLGKPYLKASTKVNSRRINAIRSSGNLIYGTEQNNIGQFNPLDTFEVPIENGKIMSLQRASRLQGDGDMLLAICENETSYVLLGDSSGSQSSNIEFRTLTSSIVGSIRNLGMRAGIQDRKSVYNHDGDIYWWDNNKSIVCQYTKKGLDIISNKDMKSDFLSKSGVANICVDPFYKILFVSINGGISTGYKIDEEKWVSDYDITFDGAINDGDRCLFFKNGLIYRSLENASGNKVGEYMGTSYAGYIKLTANTVIPIIPLNIILSHNMNVTDYTQTNRVKASVIDIEITNENGQATDIKESNFLLKDNKLFSHVMRDKNNGTIVNGRFIKGFTNNFKINLKDLTQENRIFGVDISFDKVNGH